jgi:hypothetical protein
MLVVGLGPLDGRADLVRVARSFAADAGPSQAPITPQMVSERLCSE